MNIKNNNYDGYLLLIFLVILVSTSFLVVFIPQFSSIDSWITVYKTGGHEVKFPILVIINFASLILMISYAVKIYIFVILQRRKEKEVVE